MGGLGVRRPRRPCPPPGDRRGGPRSAARPCCASRWACAGLADVFACADELVKAAEADANEVSGTRDEAEKDALKTAMGHGGTGKGTASATRGSAAAIKELERRQKSRATRTQRDAIDLALVDLAGFYRDVLVAAAGDGRALNHPDRAARRRQAAGVLVAGVDPAPPGSRPRLPRGDGTEREAKDRHRSHGHHALSRLNSLVATLSGWPGGEI